MVNKTQKLLLIIDMWKYLDNGALREPKDFPLINNVFESLVKFDVLGLSSYECFNETRGTSVWYSNTDLSLPEYSRKLEWLPHQQTFDYILNYRNVNTKQMSIRHLSELKYCVEKYGINQIYLSGGAWEMCVKDREVGYDNIIKYFPNIDLFVDTNLVATCEGKSPDMTLEKNWKHIKGSLYKYVKTGTDKDL